MAYLGSALLIQDSSQVTGLTEIAASSYRLSPMTRELVNIGVILT